MEEFVARLKAHKLVQWTLGYVAVSFALIPVLDIIAQSFGWPRAAVRCTIIALVTGFFMMLVIAWYHGERGEKRITRTEHAILATLLVLGGLTMWRIGPTAAKTAMTKPVAAISMDTPPKTTVIAAVDPKSVAVLPFANLSGDPKNAYFSDGITEEILNALTQVPDLKVAGRTSAFQFNGKNESLHKVGETLGVATILEGSVQRSGGEVRITAQLVDAHSGYQLWSEKYDRKLTSIFAIEDEISKAIADKLRVQLAGGGQPQVRSQTDDPQAHALYLQGIAKIAARGAALKDAVALFEQATVLDPDYAIAWAGLSQADELLPWYNLGDWQPSLAKAESAARRALALNPQLGEAHAALANVQRDRLDFSSAVREYHEALALNPGSSEIRNQYAQLLGAVGQLDAAIEQERIAVTLDPLAPDPRYVLGWALVCTHHSAEGIAELKKVVALAPTFAPARSRLIIGYLSVHNYAAAEQTARATAAEAGGNPTVIVELIRAAADPSLRPQALKLIGTNKDRMSLLRGPAEVPQAVWYSLLGTRNQAIETLQHWVVRSESGEVYFGMFSLWLPVFDPIRSDPRFKAVLKKMGLPYVPQSSANK